MITGMARATGKPPLAPGEEAHHRVGGAFDQAVHQASAKELEALPHQADADEEQVEQAHERHEATGDPGERGVAVGVR
jgi:hypothetical protein